MNLTSTAPAAFDALFALVQTAGTGYTAQNVYVVDTELLQYEPAVYVEMSGIANHKFEIAALGSYAFYENYDIEGVLRVFLGDSDFSLARTQAYDAFQALIITTLIDNRTLSGLVEYIIPQDANSTCEVTSQGGAQCQIEFALNLQARLTV